MNNHNICLCKYEKYMNIYEKYIPDSPSYLKSMKFIDLYLFQLKSIDICFFFLST